MRHSYLIAGIVTVGCALSAGAQTLPTGGKTTQLVPAGSPMLYKVSFRSGNRVSGITATPAVRLPFQCANDGTVFVSFIGTISAGSGLPPSPPGPLPMLLTSIPLSGPGRVYRLDSVPDLYIASEIDHYVTDAAVIFLVRASRENTQEQVAYSVGSYHGQTTRNTAEQHSYILIFDREGNFQRLIEIPDTFEMQRIAVFPSGAFLTFGFDLKKHVPELSMLKEDGTFLKSLLFAEGDAPDSMISSGTSQHPHTVLPSQLIASGRSILVVQNQSAYPILEVSEGGEIRVIRLKLPKGDEIESVIPSNQDLYVVQSDPSQKPDLAEQILQISLEDGSVFKRFVLAEEQVTPDSIACVYNGKFLSMDYKDGGVVPLIGLPEPADASSH